MSDEEKATRSRIPTLRLTRSGCVRWICDLQEAGLMFHFDDDPAIALQAGSDVRLFTDLEAIVLHVMLLNVFEILDDPFEICLQLTDS